MPRASSQVTLAHGMASPAKDTGLPSLGQFVAKLELVSEIPLPPPLPSPDSVSVSSWPPPPSFWLHSGNLHMALMGHRTLHPTCPFRSITCLHLSDSLLQFQSPQEEFRGSHSSFQVRKTSQKLSAGGIDSGHLSLLWAGGWAGRD